MRNDQLLIAMSDMTDGSMSSSVDEVTKRAHRQKFLSRYNITLEQSILVRLEYVGDNYRRYYEVGFEQKGDGMAYGSSITADALFTRLPETALFLPVADCIAAVVYDSRQHILGLSHLGRHNLLQLGGSATIEFMASEYGTLPSDVSVWLSPAAGRSNYPLHDFENRSLHEVALQQLLTAGVRFDNITMDTHDTTTDQNMYSHSEFLRGNRKEDGRQSVIAMMRTAGK